MILKNDTKRPTSNRPFCLNKPMKKQIKKIADDLFTTLGEMEPKEADKVVAKNIVKLYKLLGKEIAIRRTPVFIKHYDGGCASCYENKIIDLKDELIT